METQSAACMDHCRETDAENDINAGQGGLKRRHRRINLCRAFVAKYKDYVKYPVKVY